MEYFFFKCYDDFFQYNLIFLLELSTVVFLKNGDKFTKIVYLTQLALCLFQLHSLHIENYF